jgi:hypothetical protein
MAEHVILITPSRPGRFDVRVEGSDQFLVEGTGTPLRDSAVALLATGLAAPADTIVMRFAGSDRDLLRSRIDVADELTREVA